MFCQADHHPKLQLPGSEAFASTSKRSMQASGSGMLFYDHWGKGSNINEVSKSSCLGGSVWKTTLLAAQFQQRDTS